MKKAWFLIACFALVVSSCGGERPTPTVSPELIETQIAVIQTKGPSELPTIIPSTEPTQPPPATTPTIQLSPTSLPTVTEQPTQPPTPTLATVLPPNGNDPRSLLGTPSFQETFENENNWPVGEDQYTNLELVDHTLRLTGLTRTDGWKLTWPKGKDFYLEATFNSGACSGTDRYGLVARVPNLDEANKAYIVGATCDGKYSLRKWNSEKMTNLIDWTASKNILSGQKQVNRIGLLAEGSQLSIYINGVLQKSIEDAYLSEGYFGIFVGANQSQNYAVTITQLDYWDNPNL